MRSAVQTNEGVVAYDEAIALLQHMSPMGRLEIAGPMCTANAAHVADIGASGATGHVGADGSKAVQRLHKGGGVVQGGSAVKEGIEFGPWKDGANFVVALVVGDGEPSRTHRKILLNPAATVCGVSLGAHKLYGKVCVVTVAENCAVVPAST